MDAQQRPIVSHLAEDPRSNSLPNRFVDDQARCRRLDIWIIVQLTYKRLGEPRLVDGRMATADPDVPVSQKPTDGLVSPRDPNTDAGPPYGRTVPCIAVDDQRRVESLAAETPG
jgi:hypothetical protein